MADGGQGRGQQQRCTDTLHGTGDIQQQHAGRGATAQGGENKNPQAPHQGFLAAEAVGNAPGWQQQGGECQHIGADYPFDIGEIGAQVAGNGRQGHGDDVGVEDNQRTDPGGGQQGKAGADPAHGRIT